MRNSHFLLAFLTSLFFSLSLSHAHSLHFFVDGRLMSSGRKKSLMDLAWQIWRFIEYTMKVI